MALTREQVAAMSPEERDAMEAQIKARMAQQPQGLLPRQNPMQGLGRLIAGAGQAYTTGKVPMDMFEQGGTAEPDWYTKQQVEQENAREMEKYKAELKPRGTKYQKIGRQLVAIDQDTGDVQTLFEEPEKEKSAYERAAEANLEDRERRKKLATESVVNSARDTLATIGEVEKGLTMPTGFGLLGGMPSIPGTQRATWEANINKLLSSKILNTMNSMKEASRTGATGFGQLSEKELKVLQDASTALKRTLSARDAKKILDDMKIELQKIVSGTETQEPTAPVDNDPLGLR